VTSPQPSPQTPDILILGRDTCEDTNRSRAHLDNQGIPYRYGNVEVDPEADARNRSYNAGERVTPVILFGDPERPSHVLIEPSNEDLDAAVRHATHRGESI
jgi:glutaredoxin